MRIAFVGDSLTWGKPGSSYLAVLRERRAEDTLLNLGRANDTVLSLYRRIAGLRFDRPFDVAFLWVGVNDVAGKASWLSRAIGFVRGQFRSRDLAQFRVYYEATLTFLCRHSERVIAVSPLLKGEDLDSEPNRQLATLSRVIEELAAQDERVEYLDLRADLASLLVSRGNSSYLSGSAIRAFLDAFTLHTDEQIDEKSAERGLRLTLDGVHLNSAGAAFVAERFLNAIDF